MKPTQVDPGHESRGLLVYIPKTEWMTSNQRDHRRVTQQKIILLRNRALTLAKQALAQGTLERYRTPVTITINTYYRAGPGLDDDNSQPSVKVIKDALVLAGVLTDDSAKYVRATTYLASVKDPTLEIGWHAIRITIRPV